MFKDTLITARRKKREAWIVLCCFAAAFIFNVIGIIKFGSPAIELFTQLHIVLLVAVFFYILLAVFRILFYLIKLLFGRRNAG